MFGIIIIDIPNSLIGKESKLLKLKGGEKAIKIRREIYCRLEEYHTLRIQKSMSFLFCETQRNNIETLSEEISLLQGEISMFNLDLDDKGIKTLKCNTSKLINNSKLELNRLIEKEKKQRIKNKVYKEIDNQLEKLLCWNEFIDYDDHLKQLIEQGSIILSKDTL